MKQTNSKNNTMITDWLEEYGDPEIEQQVARNLAIAERIHQALEQQQLSEESFARHFGASPSRVRSWLTGMPTIHPDDLHRIAVLLNIDFATLDS